MYNKKNNMAIETTRVIVNPANNEVYPYVYFSLAISAKVDLLKPAVDIEGTVAFRLTPYRILENGLPDVYEDGAYSVAIDDVYKEASIDPLLLQSMGTVLYGVQQFIQAKGL